MVYLASLHFNTVFNIPGMSVAAVASSLVWSLGTVARSVAQASPAVLRGTPQSLRVLGVGLQSSLAWSPLLTQVRHRYWKERQVESPPMIKNYGLEDKIHNKGMLNTLLLLGLQLNSSKIQNDCDQNYFG